MPTKIRGEVQSFLKKYQAEYGRTPDSMAALGYDAANLLFDAMERAPSLSGTDLAAAIASTKDFKGVTGTISINSDRDANKSAVIQQVNNGTFSYLTTIDPPKVDANAGGFRDCAPDDRVKRPVDSRSSSGTMPGHLSPKP